MRRAYILPLASAVLALGLSSGAHAGKSDDTLNVAIDRELESIDNYYNTAREGIVISRMVWDALLYRDPQTNEYLPNLATAYKWVDSKTLEFDLRKRRSEVNSNATSLILKTASSEAAAEKVRIDSSGRVNIGANSSTSVSGYNLKVESSGNVQYLLKAAANFNSTISYLYQPVN